jgi:hypothetical protein
MSDGLGILMSLLAVVGPLVLAWYIVSRYLSPRDPRSPRKPKP